MLSQQAYASAEDVFGYGVRSSAMGATGSAIGEGYETVYGNPALLSSVHERRLTLGILGAMFDFRANDKRLVYRPLHGSYIGATLPIPFGGLLRDRVTLGLGFFTPFDVVVRGRILYPETPQILLGDRTQSVAVQAGLGIDLGNGIRIGGGFAALAALSGSVEVATDTSGRIGTVVEDTLLASYGPIVGASYDINERYRIGVTFRGELVGHFNVVINVKDLGSITVPPLNISGVAQYDPWQIALEAARVQGPWKAAVGLTYKHWSAYPGPPEATVRCPTIDPDTGEPFSGTCDVLVPQDPGYSDIVVPHVGVERAFATTQNISMFVRGGAFLEPSPAPEQTGESNLFDNMRLALTLGYGTALNDPLPRITLDFFTQVQLLLPRGHDKAQSVPANNPGSPHTDTKGFVLAFGSTAGVAF